MPAQVRVHLFATAREAVGAGELRWEIPGNGSTLTELLARLSEAHPRLLPILPGSRLLVNGQYVRPSGTRVRDGDEVAIHPPYSGG
ncbi:MAG: MoaD/ThiS family protein [Thermoplasmata archaeon]|jgi:molybdopterin converting factor small subunit|nr:MoaD/ThiS family protein [Thermoplasmata archaeon]